MPGLLPHVDPDGLLEYSVVYTDRALNHMSDSFQGVMNDISTTLKSVYRAEAVVVVPGSGTFGMEAVARQFAHDADCFVVRNGWFSYRWSQILEAAGLPRSERVFKAKPASDDPTAPFAPVPIDELTAAIRDHSPDIVFAPHVETSSGIMLPNSYLRVLAQATRDTGGLFVLDCIASGAVWVDMADLGVDVLVSAPQKGWSGSPCCGLVMLGGRAVERLSTTSSSSFSCDLAKWHQIMQAYESGGHAYHATMPTDGLKAFANAMNETVALGLDEAKSRQLELGRRVRALLAQRGFPSVAAEGFEAPAVVVSYTDDAGIKSGIRFGEVGVQVAAGVPLACDEGADFTTFRIGLFGLDKLADVDRTVSTLEEALDGIGV